MLETKSIDKMSTTYLPTEEAPAVGTADSIDPSLIIEQRQAECMDYINKTASTLKGKIPILVLCFWTFISNFICMYIIEYDKQYYFM